MTIANILSFIVLVQQLMSLDSAVPRSTVLQMIMKLHVAVWCYSLRLTAEQINEETDVTSVATVIVVAAAAAAWTSGKS